jgi:hypothetical protein
MTSIWDRMHPSDADADWGVSEDRTSARLMLPLVRVGRRALPAPPLLLVPADPHDSPTPVELTWHVNSAEPAFVATGHLAVKGSLSTPRGDAST